jgi:pilus assembly protein Flp/PilA
MSFSDDPLQGGESTMSSIVNRVRQFLTSEDGPTAVEYAVMLALILVACISIVTTLGTTVSGTFNKVNSTLSS